MKKISLTLIALAALVASNIAAAQQSQTYLGLQVGSARADINCSGTSTCDKSDTGVKIYGGYKFTPNWALELGYTDFGKVRATGTFNSVNVDVGIKATSLGIGAAYLLPFNDQWSGVVRAGIASNEAKVTGSAMGVNVSDSQRKTEPYLGLGVGYAINKQVTVTGNWDWTKAEYSGESAKINMISLGVNFAF